MGACLVVGILFLNILPAHTDIDGLQSDFPFTFVAAIVQKASSKVVAIGAVISRHWVLTAAHLLPDDSTGIDAKSFSIIAGAPVNDYHPSYVFTHPAYTWGLYTAEDLALFYIEEEIDAVPVLLPEGRFPWNTVECFFIYWNEKSLMYFKNKITVLHNCLIEKRFVPMGLLEFYLNDILCGAGNTVPDCLGGTGGLQFCENMLVGMLIKSSWCENKTANFTDIGAHFAWLNSRADDASYIRLRSYDSSQPPQALPHLLAVFLPLLTLANRH